MAQVMMSSLCQCVSDTVRCKDVGKVLDNAGFLSNDDDGRRRINPPTTVAEPSFANQRQPHMCLKCVIS